MTCPNRDGTLSTGGCIFCNPAGSGTGAYRRGLSITRQINDARERLKKRYKAKGFLVYFQAFTNTYAPVSRLRQLYDEAMAVPEVVGLAIGTRPDCVDKEKIDLIASCAQNGMVWVEYGLQTAHDKTLRAINRGHDVRAFEDAMALTCGKGILTCAHIILGLPGETRDQMMATADYIARSGVDGVKLHLLYVVRGTPLEAAWENGELVCMTQTAYVDAVCEFIERLPASMVIQRVTGDPHPNELISPAWSLKKTETLQLIHERFDKKGTRQGSLYPGTSA